MGMSNPHNPEKALWDSYMEWTTAYKKDPTNGAAKQNSDYYYDQWSKLVEKRVVDELKSHKVKDTPADKIKKPKTKLV